jgi:hypothetical protein
MIRFTLWLPCWKYPRYPVGGSAPGRSARGTLTVISTPVAQHVVSHCTDSYSGSTKRAPYISSNMRHVDKYFKQKLQILMRPILSCTELSWKILIRAVLHFYVIKLKQYPGHWLNKNVYASPKFKLHAYSVGQPFVFKSSTFRDFKRRIAEGRNMEAISPLGQADVKQTNVGL